MAQTTRTVAIGTRKGLWFATQDTGSAAWSLSAPRHITQEVPALAWDPTSDGRLLASVRSEHWGPTVMSSSDLGESWDEPEGGAIQFPSDSGAALERVWQLRPDLDRPGTVWAGCEPHSLWHSTDGGSSFALVGGLWDHPHRTTWEPGGGGAAVHTVLPHPRDPDRLTVAMSAGGVYRSDDGTASWRPANRGIQAYFLPDPDPEYGQCVHKVARDAEDPERLYAQNHFGVYRSDDGGDRWASIADGLPADFGFNVLAHPTRGGTAWVVPLVADGERVAPGGQLRVWRTDDAGGTWTCSRSGLPDGCWAAVLRDAADVVSGPDGAEVFLGTRDGCVYASGDEGTTFTEVARHLPDVLCVRALVQ